MIGMIVAHDVNKAIGHDNKLLWSSSEDLQHFKETTMGGVLLFGRETAESIGRPLPGRKCLVLSKDFNYHLEGFTTLTPETIDRAWLESLSNGKSLWICGGGGIYEQCLEYVDKLVVSLVHDEVENADTFFPELTHDWQHAVDLNLEPYKQFPPTEQCPYQIDVFEYTR